MGFVTTAADFMTIEETKNEQGWPPEYTASMGIIPYVKRMKGEVKGIEIGTARGESAFLLLESCPNIKTLDTIDPYVEYMDWVGIIPQDVMDRFKGLATRNLEVFKERAIMHNAKAADVIQNFEDRAYDFLFIDGDHSQEGVYSDLAYASKVKSGGLIAVHDTNLGSVNTAVRSWREVNKERSPMHNVLNGVVYWIKTSWSV